MVSFFKALLEIALVGEVSPHKGPLLEQQLPPGGVGGSYPTLQLLLHI